jgi:S1-C subfamily serine protease
MFQHGGRGIWIEDNTMIKSGMSGSPIVDADGAAVGVVSTGILNPRLSADLPGWLLSP